MRAASRRKVQIRNTEDFDEVIKKRHRKGARAKCPTTEIKIIFNVLAELPLSNA